ncbi:MAG: hypothetical protein ACYSUK_07155 [Planctomycetota bacterium]|jgi:hypothetical protein
MSNRKNKRLIIFFLLLFFVNIWILITIGFATRLAKDLWQMVGFENIETLTFMAIRTGIIWPVFFLLISLTGLVLSIWSNIKEHILFNLFCTIVIVELFIMSLHTFSLLLPNITINWGLGTS